MENLNLHILTPNKDAKRFFGVDYFMNLLTGNNPMFKYLSTAMDFNPVYKEGPVSFLPEMLKFLEMELSTKPEGSIIGIEINPDIYEGVESLEEILDMLKKYGMGLFLETQSLKVLDDLDLLKSFSESNPLLIGIPAAAMDQGSEFFHAENQLDHAIKLLSKIKAYHIKAGLLVKPIIPYINDDLESFATIIEKAIDINVDFVFPAFSVKFDSKKIKAFYDMIDHWHPELLVKYHDEYGMRFVWESPNMSELKKHFVILCKKNKTIYAMKDIINLYKPDLNIQLKLF